MYTPISIRHTLWDDLSTDFVPEVPKMARGHDSIFVVIDRFYKMAHCIPCSMSSDVSYIAKLFSKEVVCLHGLPVNIMSDHDVKFVSYFWTILQKLFKTAHKFFSTFHP